VEQSDHDEKDGDRVDPVDGPCQVGKQWRGDKATEEQVTGDHLLLENGSRSLLIGGFFPRGN
jgi:hypothetical protein